MYFFFFSGGIFLRYCIVSIFERAVVLTTCDGYMRLHSQQWASDQVGRPRNHQALKPISKHLVFWDLSCHYFFLEPAFQSKLLAVGWRRVRRKAGHWEDRGSSSGWRGSNFLPCCHRKCWMKQLTFQNLEIDVNIFFWVWGVWLELGWLVLLLMSGLLGMPCEDKWPVGQKAVAPWRYKSLDSKILKWMLCCLGFLSSTCWENTVTFPPKKKGAETQSRLDSFWWPLETAGKLVRLRSWNTKSNGDPLRPWHVNDKLQAERFVSLGIRVSSKRL